MVRRVVCFLLSLLLAFPMLPVVHAQEQAEQQAEQQTEQQPLPVVFLPTKELNALQERVRPPVVSRSGTPKPRWMMIAYKDLNQMSPKTRAFVQKYGPMAETIASTYGLNAAVALGQAGLESAWGTSEACLQANNFFGIKAQPGKPTWMDGEVAYRKFASPSECWVEYGHMMTAADHPYRKALPWKDSIWHYADMLRTLGYCPNPDYGAKVLGACEVFLDPQAAEIEEALGKMERNHIIMPPTPVSRTEYITREQLAVILLRYHLHKGAWLEAAI